MKMYRKSDLHTIQGLIVTIDDDIVMPSIDIIEQANELETLLQQAIYLSDQPEATPEPSLDGFVRRTNKVQGGFTARTPVLDSKVEEAMALMDEIDGMAAADAANQMHEKFDKLIQFVASDFVIDCGSTVMEFDTPVLGNVLELTIKDVVSAIGTICGVPDIKFHKDDDDTADDDTSVKHVMSDGDIADLLDIRDALADLGIDDEGDSEE